MGKMISILFYEVRTYSSDWNKPVYISWDYIFKPRFHTKLYLHAIYFIKD